MSASPLAASASPYLRAHADNPVAWYPWGEEAFAEARRREVPVLVSIGYATCHWCHVMARESFQDAATAAVLDDGFVAIKVDREEHPEVDEAYLAAAGAFTQNLGWPLTVFTTPAGHVFYAGTYFPPTARGGIPAFRDVLAAVQEAWQARRAEVEQTATAVVAALSQAAARVAGSEPHEPTEAELFAAAQQIVAAEDLEYGGFAGPGASMQTPKFPMAPALRFLAAMPTATPGADADAHAGADSAPVATAERALAAMAASALRDPVDGGFFRYATRRDWTVPHYERMLTDNASLIDLALALGADDVARRAAHFVIEVLQQPTGGYAAAQDSESTVDGERREGDYYRADAASRAQWEAPPIDGKIVTGWNGLAIGALARAGQRLGDALLIESARRAADAVLETNVLETNVLQTNVLETNVLETNALHTNALPSGSIVLRRASLDGIPSPAVAVLEDYGLLADGLATLAEVTGEVGYATVARRLVDACVPPASAADATGSVPGGRDPVLAAHGIEAPPDTTDGTHPSGPAALAAAELHLWRLGAGERYRDAAAAVVRRHASAALGAPLSHGALLRTAADLVRAPHQLVVVTAAASPSPLTEAAVRIPADVTAIVTEAQARVFADAGFDLFAGRTLRDGGAVAYDCQGFVCRLPTSDPAQLLANRW